MGFTLELPQPLYEALQGAATAAGMSPADWVAARLAEHTTDSPLLAAPRTMADLLVGRIGQFASGGRHRLSEETGRAFADDLEARRQAGWS